MEVYKPTHTQQPTPTQFKARKFEAFALLVYGQSGIGKTVFCASVLEVPELNPCLFLNYEAGTKSIKSKVNKIDITELGKNTQPGKLDVIRIKKWDDLDKILDYLYSNKNVYKSVIVDSVSEINYLCESHVVATVNNARNAKGVPSLNDYGVSATYMRKVIRSFRNLAEDTDISSIISASAQREKDEGTGIITLMPNLTGKLAYEVQGMVDAVGYMRMDKKDKREILFQPTSTIHAKDRNEGGQLGAFITEPTVNKIIELIKEE